MRLAADALGLSLPLKPPDREVAAERLKRVEAKVGEAALGRLFVFYRSADGLSAGRPRPNIVFTSLSDTCPGVRHPVYFLALFFGAGLGGEAIVGRSELGDREGKSDADGSDAAKGRRV